MNQILFLHKNSTYIATPSAASDGYVKLTIDSPLPLENYAMVREGETFYVLADSIPGLVL